MSAPSTPKTISVIGSGNWGSVVAKIIGTNALNIPEVDSNVRMYVFQETINGRKLTDIINELHENIKYLPGFKLPENVFATPSLIEATQDADLLVFVLPHQFIHSTCCTLKARIKTTAVGISLIKGFHKRPNGGIELISNIISKSLNIPCYVLMGANLALDIVTEHISEATIGCDDRELAVTFKKLFQTPHFRIAISEDREAVEIFGALKNIVACSVGLFHGLDLSDNSKAMAMRLGIVEMMRFTKLLFPKAQIATMFESCGIADVFVSTLGGRNYKASLEFVKSGKSLQMIEEELLKGQKLQGPLTAMEVNYMLKEKNMEDKFPIFTAVHRIFQHEMKPEELMECLKNHPAQEENLI